MGLLARITPIADELEAAKVAVEETLRQITYTQDREAVRAQLRAAAVHADKAAANLNSLARAIDSGFGTLPETRHSPFDEVAPAEDDDEPYHGAGAVAPAVEGADVVAVEGDRDV